MLKKEGVSSVAEHMLEYLLTRVNESMRHLDEARHLKPDGHKEALMSGFTARDGTVGIVLIVENMAAVGEVLAPEMAEAIAEAAEGFSVSAVSKAPPMSGPIGQA